MAAIFSHEGPMTTLRVDVGSSTVNAGDPVTYGNITGFALDDKDSDNKVVIQLSGVAGGVVRKVVEGNDNSTGAAVNAGDLVYDDSGTLNVDSTDGTAVGVAYDEDTEAGSELVASGNTSTTIGIVLYNGLA